MSNWNVLSVEAALQQLNAFEGDDPEKTIRCPNTVSESIFFFFFFPISAFTGREKKELTKLLSLQLREIFLEITYIGGQLSNERIE